MKFTKLTGAAVAALMAAGSSAVAETEVQWWHAMGGTNGERVNKIAADFNATQSEYKVVPVYKGNYTETMTAAIAAFRAKEHPHIVQVFEVGTATMMAAKGAILPVEQMMNEAGEPFDKSDYLPAVISYYQTPQGELLSMPFNSSTPVLWYNADALKAAGAEPPKTWDDVKSVSKKLVDSGMKCGLSFGWQSWVMIENYSAWHNIPLGTKENGFAGFDTEFTFNNDKVAGLLGTVAQMGKDGTFHLRRSSRRQPAAVYQRRMRHVDELVGLLWLDQVTGEVQFRPDDAAAGYTGSFRAAELHHRWRDPSGFWAVTKPRNTRARPSS